MFAGFTSTEALDGTVEVAEDDGPEDWPQPATQTATQTVTTIDANRRTRC